MQNTIQRGEVPLQPRPEISRGSAVRPAPPGTRRTVGRRILHDVASLARRNWLRELWDWSQCDHVELPTAQELIRSLEMLGGEAEVSELDDECPIFLLSTGWRSGSTLLQRVLVTDPNVLLWGEPFGEAAIFYQLSKVLSDLATLPEILPSTEHNDEKFAALSTSWIATLCPQNSQLRRGLQSFLFAWLGQSARERGFARWGFKEVRLGSTEATLLHWLFPKAKFVLLSRNPFDCYRSLADSGWHHLYFRRPDIRVDSAAGIARHWNRIATGWAELPDSFPVFRIRYEDLIDRKVNFRELESWLEVKLDEDVALSVFVGRTARRKALGMVEQWIIAHEARAGIRALGYGGVDTARSRAMETTSDRG